jgi:hypothetical protein
MARNNVNCLDSYSIQISTAPGKEAGARKPDFFHFLSRVWQNLANQIFTTPDLQVRQTRDRFGNSKWRVYDPFTEQSNSFASEDEVRAWIEQHYYHSTKT